MDMLEKFRMAVTLQSVLSLELVPCLVQGAEHRGTDHLLLRRGRLRKLHKEEKQLARSTS